MTAQTEIRELTNQYGFVTDLDTDSAPRGLDEDVIRLISAKKQRSLDKASYFRAYGFPHARSLSGWAPDLLPVREPGV